VPVHGKCIASQELRAEPGILQTEVGTICPTYADAQVLLEARVLERARVANTLVAPSDLSPLRAVRFRGLLSRLPAG
jgi:hypothetical protein